MNEITQDLLKELFEYKDGNLYWEVAKGRRMKIGNLAGFFRKDGYRVIRIDGKPYYAHRLIFLYHQGYLPEFLDHIDGNRSNNDITNLREATLSQNQWNQKKDKFINGKSTSSQFKGIYWHKHAKKWRVQIQIDGKRKHLGYYVSEIEAAESYDHAATKAFGEFAHTNEVK